MKTNNNFDVSYLQSQSWNHRNNKFDLSSEQNEASNVFVNEEKIEISESGSLDQISSISKNEINEPFQESEDSLIQIKDEITITEKEKIETISKARLVEIQESIPESQINKSEENTVSNLKKENSEYQAKSGFHQWLRDLSQETESKNSESKKPKIPQIPNKPPRPLKTELEEIKDLSPASETLASLLVSQGYHKEAIAMYEKLSTLFPEKKATFAALIGKLKN